MAGDEGPVFFGDAWDVGPAVVDPGVFGFQALPEEDHVGLHSLAIGGEGTVGEAQQGVHVAVFHKVLDDVACGRRRKRTLSGSTMAARPPLLSMVTTCWMKLSCLLLVLTVKSSRTGAWLAPLVPKGGLVRMQSYRSPRSGFVDAVAQVNARLKPVEEEVHQGQSPGPGDEFLAVVCVFFDALDVFSVQRSFGDVHEPFVGDHQKAGSSAGGGRRW